MELVDVFTINWGGDNDLWSPAVTLIPRMIGHAEVCKAVGTGCARLAIGHRMVYFTSSSRTIC